VSGEENDGRCTAVGPANEYCRVATRCERPAGHDGPHVAELGPSSRRIWDAVPFPVNYAKKAPHAG